MCACVRTRVSVSSHHPLHSSLSLAALALCRCCWAELRFEGWVPHQNSRSIFKGSAGPCACGQRRECHPGAQLQSYFSAASQLGISWIRRGRPGAWWGLAAHTPHSFHGREGIEDPFYGPLVELYDLESACLSSNPDRNIYYYWKKKFQPGTVPTSCENTKRLI